MAIINCPECGKEISDKAATCPNCGYPISALVSNAESKSESQNEISAEKPPKERKPVNKKKLIGIMAGAVAVVAAVFLFIIFLAPVAPQGLCYHKYLAATCVDEKHCKRCGKVDGPALGHSWIEATCTEAKKCSVCGLVEGDAKGHRWKEATCEKPKYCFECKVTEGKEKGHSWAAATCTEAKRCTRCGAHTGSSLGHNLVDYICSRCGESEVYWDDVPKIFEIKNQWYEINYVGGIDWNMTFVNRSSTKTINYIEIEIEFFNAVGDKLKDEISRLDYATLLYTGPLGPGRTSQSVYWRACFYNSTYSGVTNLRKVTITYSDGSVLVIDDCDANNAVISWRK